ncbi:hypothetical protein AYR62_03680 [Secundilactobacillus paracollinoides]|uniref:HTH tetR-type domain-containing protein n=1 Tax=Secundilactobacillus paracollinoides TaxID=240427 RepID=A0A1B2J004_9LACO|nr:TetR/AcrR family transcriptional regulator [Secundilactobacillus paracollinoides]ANZ61652.1 hypothetical protein AYR61_09965 [Secundilactobacillus paracollinoides]ANZ63290.1 hypothetical protein AYR62_03680 [Secundilactobacillus paracollinoides]ANZ67570.1 hypothetical protein AYR63_10710 [Secundilactobacillus paracollinoides]KRL79962.1 transcriptional regulator [Secundilactobacillus paracollinoides DSM 15502 = JCM 11969]
MTAQTTDEKILDAFSQLALKYGYQGTTTKKIAEEAGVNESTIFRHFKDKRTILEHIIDAYLVDMEKVGQSFDYSGDIVTDLKRVADLYTTFVQNHLVVFLVGVRESYQFPEVGQALQQLPIRFVSLVKENFIRMQAAGEISADTDTDSEAVNFVLMNFGNAVFTFSFQNTKMAIPMPTFKENNVQAFAAHLQGR